MGSLYWGYIGLMENGNFRDYREYIGFLKLYSMGIVEEFLSRPYRN